MKIACAKCGAENAPLFRINEKGVPGIFWCEFCIAENKKPVDQKTIDVGNIIYDIGNEKKEEPVSMKIEDTKFFGFTKNFFVNRGKEFENIHAVHYRNTPPFDSFDRMFALYLLETRPELVPLVYTEFEKQAGEDLLKEWEAVSEWAYHNYEREWMSKESAWSNLAAVARKGWDYTVADTYGDGGWFGAS